MPKRTSKADDDTKDPPEVIQKRRIVKVSERFRRANAFPSVKPPPSSSVVGAFGGAALGPANLGQANPFSGVNVGASSSSLFGPSEPSSSVFGGSLSGGTAVGAPTPAFTFSAGASSSWPSDGALFGGSAASAPSGSAVAAPPGSAGAAPGGFFFPSNTLPSTTNAVPDPPAPGAIAGFSFPNYTAPPGGNAKPTTAASSVTIPPSATNDKTTPVSGGGQPHGTLGPSSRKVDFSPKTVPIMVEAITVGQSTSRRHAGTENPSPSTTSGLPFGSGPTAAQGIRLNKMFASWISHQVATNSASTLDVGLLDYVTFASEIRNRADFSRVDTTTTAGTALKHPSAPSVFTPAAASDPVPPVALTVADMPPVAPAPAPVSAPAPTPSLASAVVSTPAFSFSAPSTLPAAPSGALFSFGGSSASTSNTSATPAIIAPSTASPTKGFKLDSGGFGMPGGASPPPFKGFQVPAGGGMAPPAPPAPTEEDGMPKEDPSKLERAPGEENEQILGSFRAKLYCFKKDEKVWGDMGVGLLRLMKHTTNDARRLVLRNDMGKVLLNTALYKGMKVTKTKNSIKFVASIAGGGPTSIMIKVTVAQLPELHEKVEGLLPSS